MCWMRNCNRTFRQTHACTHARTAWNCHRNIQIKQNKAHTHTHAKERTSRKEISHKPKCVQVMMLMEGGKKRDSNSEWQKSKSENLNWNHDMFIEFKRMTHSHTHPGKLRLSLSILRVLKDMNKQSNGVFINPISLLPHLTSIGFTRTRTYSILFANKNKSKIKSECAKMATKMDVYFDITMEIIGWSPKCWTFDV